MIKAIMIEKPHRAIALTDGWLCIKYLEGGEESLTTFADISKGDVITYNHLKDVQAERDKVLDEILKWLCDMDGGDVVYNPKLGLFSSPQPFNTVGLIQKLQDLHQQSKQEEQG